MNAFFTAAMVAVLVVCVLAILAVLVTLRPPKNDRDPK